MNQPPRVAFFCETFHEINGVALTARELVSFARRHSRPFLAVQPGECCAEFQEGSVTRLELPRGPVSFGIECDLRYDLLLCRHLPLLRRTVEKFRPDVIHVTSPGEFGQLGAWLAHTLHIPLVASWHTNFHEYAGRRLSNVLRPLGSRFTQSAHDWAEHNTLRLLLRFYRIARATLAPTPDQVHWLESSTGRPSFLMPRGVDQNLFHPHKRTTQDSTLRIGFVGRVTPEKGVRLLCEIERALVAAGHAQFEIHVIGQGSELPWLRERLSHGVFPGILRGQLLAEAYANLDLFVFPSRTDTYGNVIQEAAASGVPAVVTSSGGPKNLVLDGATGIVAADDEAFLRAVICLASDRKRLIQMGLAAREHLVGNSWDAAFEMTYSAYNYCQQFAASVRTASRKSAFATP